MYILQSYLMNVASRNFDEGGETFRIHPFSEAFIEAAHTYTLF